MTQNTAWCAIAGAELGALAQMGDLDSPQGSNRDWPLRTGVQVLLQALLSQALPAVAGGSCALVSDRLVRAPKTGAGKPSALV